jgi:hypothetical protein
MTPLNWNLDTLFLYLGYSIMGLSDYDKESVVQGMAYKLIEWDTITRDQLRPVMLKYGWKLEERCIHCNELMPEYEGGGDPICDDCI